MTNQNPTRKPKRAKKITIQFVEDKNGKGSYKLADSKAGK